MSYFSGFMLVSLPVYSVYMLNAPLRLEMARFVSFQIAISMATLEKHTPLKWHSVPERAIGDTDRVRRPRQGKYSLHKFVGYCYYFKCIDIIQIQDIPFIIGK